MDPYLREHLPALVAAIKNRCVVQYFSPYLSVGLEPMAEAFGCSVPDMEATVAKLVMDGKVSTGGPPPIEEKKGQGRDAAGQAQLFLFFFFFFKI